MRINNFLKSRGIFLLLFIASLLFFTGIAQSSDLKVRITTDKAYVRLKADTASPIVGKVPIGTILESEEKVGEWYLVSLPPDERGFVITGYIHQNVVEVVGGTKEVTMEKRQREKPVKTEKITKEPARPVRQPEYRREMAPQRKLYLKGTIGFGIGFEKIATGLYKVYEDDREPKEIFIYPGGGINAEAVLGYRVISSLAVELGIGYQSSGTSVKDDTVYFRRIPLTITLINEFKSGGSIKFYAGGGGGLYFSPKTYAAVGEGTVDIKYDSSFGFHGLVGITTRTQAKPLFFFWEAKFVGFTKYKWNEATLNGYSAIPTTEFQEMNGNGIFINFGICYSF